MESDSGIENGSVKRGQTFWQRTGIFAAILIAAFLLGLIPMWLSARSYAYERDTARTELRLSQMQNHLATATIQARRGEYEQARNAASDFLTNLQTEVDNSTGAFNQQQRESLQPILTHRDVLITLLARSDPASADRLADLYLIYLQAKNPAEQNTLSK
jgi:Na+-transporting NADH:ubiquinone oxidoreductase subunit NqrC